MNTIRIGTRDSKLARWQASSVQSKLAIVGIQSKLIFIKSEGDQDQDTPLDKIGAKGVFTKILDSALIDDEIENTQQHTKVNFLQK